LPFAALIDGALVTGAIDRVVFFPSQDAPQRIAFYDYKTDEINGADGVTRVVALYRTQMELYRKALCQGYGLPPAKVVGALILLARDEVARVD
jgi:hypothetical protein